MIDWNILLANSDLLTLLVVWLSIITVCVSAVAIKEHSK